MSDNAVLAERLDTHIDLSDKLHARHEQRFTPLEDFMKEVKIDIKWVQKIGLGILAVVISPYAIELFKYLLNKQ